MADALNVLEGLALHDGPAMATHPRVAGHQGKLYLDLGDAQWRAVEIGAWGWRLAQAPPVRFRRAKGMMPLPEPTPGGSPEELRPLVNVRDGGLLVLEGGANLRTNRNREQLTLIDDPVACDFHDRWFDDELSRHEGDGDGG